MGRHTPIFYLVAQIVPAWAWVITLATVWFTPAVQIVAALAGTAWSVLMIWESDTVKGWRGVRPDPTTIGWQVRTDMKDGNK